MTCIHAGTPEAFADLVQRFADHLVRALQILFSIYIQSNSVPPSRGEGVYQLVEADI